MISQQNSRFSSEENERDKLQKNAPLTKSGLFLVPKVIDATE